MLSMADIRGRDGVLPSGMPKGPVAYDSVVVNSNGIGAITFAARMARDPAFKGRVIVAAKPVAESRRLIDGCTLRARSVDYYAAALGTTREAVLAATYGPDWRQAETDRQRSAFATPFKGGVAPGPCGVFMSGDNDSFVGMVNRDGALDLCVFYPLLDPLSPLTGGRGTGFTGLDWNSFNFVVFVAGIAGAAAAAVAFAVAGLRAR